MFSACALIRLRACVPVRDQENAVPYVPPEACEHVREAQRIAGLGDVAELLDHHRIRTLPEEALHPLELAPVAVGTRNARPKGNLALEMSKRALGIEGATVARSSRGTSLTLRAAEDGCTKSQGNQETE